MEETLDLKHVLDEMLQHFSEWSEKRLDLEARIRQDMATERHDLTEMKKKVSLDLKAAKERMVNELDKEKRSQKIDINNQLKEFQSTAHKEREALKSERRKFDEEMKQQKFFISTKMFYLNSLMKMIKEQNLNFKQLLEVNKILDSGSLICSEGLEDFYNGLKALDLSTSESEGLGNESGTVGENVLDDNRDKEQLPGAAGRLVNINVGGTIFQTTDKTLRNGNASLLSRLTEDCTASENPIFFDRDPIAFSQLLSLLRSEKKCLPKPTNESESDLIANEAQYYGIRMLSAPFLSIVGGCNQNGFLSSLELIPVNELALGTNKAKEFTSCKGPAYRGPAESEEEFELDGNASIEGEFKGIREVANERETRPTFGKEMLTARALFGMGSIRQKLYICGGYNDEYRALKETEVYDALRNIWTLGPALQHPRRSMASAVDGTQCLHVCGGYDGTKILSSCEFLDPRVGRWSSFGPLNSPRSGGMMTAISDFELLFVGGSDGSRRLGTSEICDVRTRVWRTLDFALHVPRSSSAFTACSAEAGSTLSTRNASGACVCIAAGGVDSEQNLLSSTELLERDSATGQWSVSRFAALPCPIVECAGVNLEGIPVLVGGQNEDCQVQKKAFRLSHEGIWMPAFELLQPRTAHGTAILDF